jgi:hypothetical protein
MLCLRWSSVKDSGSSDWDTGFCIKSSEHFVRSLKDIGIQKEDTSVYIDVVSSFKNFPVDGVTQINKNALKKGHKLSTFFLHVDDVMDLSRLSEKPHIFI